MVTENKTISLLQNGRVSGFIAEDWAETLTNLSKSTNACQPSFDLSEPVGADTTSVSVRTLTKNGVKFQDSKRIGKGRSCSVSELKEDIKAKDFVIVVDVTKVPEIRLVKLRSANILDWVTKEKLGTGGISRERFYKQVADPDCVGKQTHDLLPVEIDLRTGKPVERETSCQLKP